MTRHPFTGTANGRPRRLSLSKPAGLETRASAQREVELPHAAPPEARNGRRIAGGLWVCPTSNGRVVFPPEPPVVSRHEPERTTAVKGAPGVGAAKQTLDSEDRSGFGETTSGGSGKTNFPAGELRVRSYAAFLSVSDSTNGGGIRNGWPDLSTASRYATSLRATASVARLRCPRSSSRVCTAFNC